MLKTQYRLFLDSVICDVDLFVPICTLTSYYHYGHRVILKVRSLLDFVLLICHSDFFEAKSHLCLRFTWPHLINFTTYEIKAVLRLRSLTCWQGEPQYLFLLDASFTILILLCFHVVILESIASIYRKVCWDFEFK